MNNILEPKYWNEETKQVEVDNVELSKKPTTLDSVLGTYRWVYYSYNFRDGDIEPDSGYITLENKSRSKATPAKISGSIQLHVHNGTFQGLSKKSIRDNGKRVGTRKYRKNFWEIKKIEWKGESGMDEEGTGFGVCEVKDDNGNPFLKFEWGYDYVEVCGQTCHGGDDCGFYVGKKVTPSDEHESDHEDSELDEECYYDEDMDEGDSDDELLTDDEKIRLGMLLSETQVEELATKGYISDEEISSASEIDD